MNSRVVVASLAAALLALAGCSSENPETYKVIGKIVYDGQPVKSGVVQLLPEGGGNSAIGNLQPDGTFQLTTFKQNDGACPGTYTVTIQAMPEEDADDPMSGLPGMEFAGSGKPPVPLKYENPETSDLKVNVNKGENSLELVLTD